MGCHAKKSSQLLIFFSLFSFILAWTFVSLQIKEFRIMGLSINDSVYSPLFFFLTGLHFFHLLVGLLLCCLLFWSCSCSSSWKCYSCFWTATSRKRNEVHKCFEEIEPLGYYFLTLRTSEIHLFYNLQLFYWHFLSSNNPLRNSTNNKIPFFPFIFQKDFFGFILILCLYFLQTHFGIFSLSHPDNSGNGIGILTPLHIVPEWYFLCQYAMLKAVPNKNAGFIILLTSILALFFFGEIRNLTTLCILNNNSFSLSFFFLSFISFLWIGAQFPQEKFLSYARILTLDYYFLLMCILF